MAAMRIQRLGTSTLSMLAFLVTVQMIAGPAQGQPAAGPWPRQYRLQDANLVAYQPQVERWQGDRLEFRVAVAATALGTSAEQLGVIWGEARTDVHPVTREVVLNDVRLSRSNFPTLPDNGARYLEELRQRLNAAPTTMSLDSLEASLAANGRIEAATVAVSNNPPEILVSYKPAILVAIAGEPVIKPVEGTWFERVINTEAAILRELGRPDFYLHIHDGWLTAPDLAGPWRRAERMPPGANRVATSLAATGEVDLMDGTKAHPAPPLTQGVPEIFVRQKPAELVVFKGQPNFQPIGGTGLLWAANTTADVLFDTTDNNFYILIAGRWFRSGAATGPWSFIASSDLPASFRQIPASSPAGAVLAAVASTPQAKEAMIEASIPRTATVPRTGGPSFKPVIDGAPELRRIEGTDLDYVANSGTPIIRDGGRYYALRSGIWFTAPTLDGPWSVAVSVPDRIYTIPASSPLHYVTYVQIYNATPNMVEVGYTQGYLGSVVAPDGVVVYGTGYDYQPWIGTTYYPAPVTYGVQAQPVYNPAVGWAYGAALGLTTAAMVDSWDHNNNNNDHNNYYYSSDYHGYPCCGSTSAHVYGAWGDTATSGNEKYYVNSSGNYEQKYSGGYTNYRTGTTGNVQANRTYDPENGKQTASYDRSFNTQSGVSGDVQRSASYNPESGKSTDDASVQATGPDGGSRQGSVDRSYDAQNGQSSTTAQRSATGQGGSSVTRDTTASDGSASRETTVDNARTGQSHSYDSTPHEDRYAGADGNVYQHSDGGWQSHASDGWHQASGSSDWADRERQARQSYGGGGGWSGGDRGGASRGRWGGGGDGGWGSRFGGGGFGGRFGGGGGGFRRW